VSDQVSRATSARLREHLDHAPFEALVLAGPENIAYVTGYRSVAGDIFRSHRMAAVVTSDDVTLVAPAADAGALSEYPVHLEPYGRFYFEGADPAHAAVGAADRHEDFAAALGVAVAGLSGRVGIDDPTLAAALRLARAVDASAWMVSLRAVKLPGEIERLAAAAGLAEQGIAVAMRAAAVGVTERELASQVAATMTAGGGMPRFVVVTAGERSALSDARATDRPLDVGDLVRFDVGCTYDGYWSDVGRTAVVSEPDDLQANRYASILAGEEAQLEMIAAGITAGQLFDVAVTTVEHHGLRPYRRHHCGHGIGRAVYEPPSVAPAGRDEILLAGMVLCLETPFYEIGWGGMMVEDTVVVTEDGHRRLTHSDRGLRVIPT
jgi:Xaa-Pro aminopeptidase